MNLTETLGYIALLCCSSELLIIQRRQGIDRRLTGWQIRYVSEEACVLTDLQQLAEDLWMPPNCIPETTKPLLRPFLLDIQKRLTCRQNPRCIVTISRRCQRQSDIEKISAHAATLCSTKDTLDG